MTGTIQKICWLSRQRAGPKYLENATTPAASRVDRGHAGFGITGHRCQTDRAPMLVGTPFPVKLSALRALGRKLWSRSCSTEGRRPAADLVRAARHAWNHARMAVAAEDR